jgi:uncharacterized protein
MRALLLAALLAGATLAPAQAQGPGGGKKELVAKILVQQQGAIDAIARGIAERPALQIAQAAEQAIGQMPAERREAAARSVSAEMRRFVDEATPLLRERALKLAPSTFGSALEEKFSEDELRQLHAWLESPTSRKYQQMLPEMQNGFVQKLVAEGAPLVDPKLKALQEKVRGIVGVPAPASKPASK